MSIALITPTPRLYDDRLQLLVMADYCELGDDDNSSGSGASGGSGGSADVGASLGVGDGVDRVTAMALSSVR